MDRPRLIRGLRIAVSVVCGIVCVLLIVLWVRSYSWHDSVVGPLTSTRGIAFSTMPGRFTMRLDDTTRKEFQQMRDWRVKCLSAEIWQDEMDRFESMFSKVTKQSFRSISSVHFGYMGNTLIFPYWLPAVATGMVAALLGVRRPYHLHFSLRTLLIATTLIAVVLGLLVWAIG